MNPETIFRFAADGSTGGVATESGVDQHVVWEAVVPQLDNGWNSLGGKQFIAAAWMSVGDDGRVEVTVGRVTMSTVSELDELFLQRLGEGGSVAAHQEKTQAELVWMLAGQAVMTVGDSPEQVQGGEEAGASVYQMVGVLASVKELVGATLRLLADGTLQVIANDQTHELKPVVTRTGQVHATESKGGAVYLAAKLTESAQG